jgi:PAS domain S-box-containing protein
VVSNHQFAVVRQGGKWRLIESSERKQAEKTLRESEEQLKILFEFAPDAYYLNDLRGNFVDGNKAAEEITGYKREELIGKSFLKLHLLPRSQIPRTIALLARNALGQATGPDEFTLNRKDGSQLPMEIKTFPVKLKGKTLVLGIARDTTERKRMEEALKESEERYRSLVNNVKLGILRSTPPGRILEANPATEEITGYSKQELLKMNVSKLYVHIEEREALLQELAPTKEKVARELQWRKKDGTEMVVLDRLVAVRDDADKVLYFDAIIEDITERKRAEELYRTLATSSPVGVYIIQERKFVFINPQFQKYTGFTEDELLGRDPLSLVHPGDKEQVRENAVEMLKGKRSSPYELRVIAKGGETLWAIETVTPTYYKGKRATLGNFMDITERKWMEEDLQEKNRQLVKQQQELIEKTNELEVVSQAKSDFLAHMSHELRTPLNVIIGFSELMLDGVPGEINNEQKQCLDDVLSSGKNLLELINDVLDLAKVESGKVNLRLSDIALTDVIEELKRTMTPILTPRRQSLDIEIEEGLPPVHADKGKLRQVLLNLLSNATKFTPDGGRLKIEAVKKDHSCQVSVADNGTGIKKEDQERLFEPFSQLDNPLTGGKGGTGLGLALSKQIIEKHGGQIWIESEYGKGSRFTFTLPLATTI